MKPIREFNKLIRRGKFAFSAFMVLAVLAALLPQPVQAATTCQAYYTVHEGDTTAYISHTFGFKWVDIATANGMKNYQKPSVGQVLCIPPASESTKTTTTTSTTTSGVKVSQPEDESNAVFAVSISGSRIYATLSNFSMDHVYLAKTRNVNTGIDGWYNLGYITVTEDSTQGFSWSVPSELSSTPVLSVCFKDQTTNELICRSALNP